MTPMMRVIFKLCVGLLSLLGILAVIGFFMPDHYSVSRSLVIEAPPGRIFDYLEDLREWRHWDAWHEMEPEARFEYSDPSHGKGAHQRWVGNRIGSGELTITGIVENERLVYDLYFADFGSRSVGKLELEPVEGGTRVTWSDSGGLGRNPYMRLLGRFFDSWIGADFERGLQRLKELAEAPVTGRYRA